MLSRSFPLRYAAEDNRRLLPGRSLILEPARLCRSSRARSRRCSVESSHSRGRLGLVLSVVIVFLANRHCESNGREGPHETRRPLAVGAVRNTRSRSAYSRLHPHALAIHPPQADRRDLGSPTDPRPPTRPYARVISLHQLQRFGRWHSGHRVTITGTDIQRSRGGILTVNLDTSPLQWVGRSARRYAS